MDNTLNREGEESSMLIFELFSHLDEAAMLFNDEWKILASTPKADRFLSADDHQSSKETLFERYPILMGMRGEIERCIAEERSIATTYDWGKSDSDDLLVELKITPLKRGSKPLYLLQLGSPPATESLQLMERSEKLISLGLLAAGVFHEIKNPIHSIANSAELIENNLQSLLQLIRMVQRCRESGDLTNKLQEILDYSEEIDIDIIVKETRDLLACLIEGSSRAIKISKGMKTFSQMEGELQPLDISSAIDSTLTLLHHELKNQIDVQREYIPLPPLYCNPTKMSQVFLNILTNAIDALPGRRGSISIKTGVEGDLVTISFKDSGCGILPEYRDKIFEPFFTTKEPSKGTGLGLSISKSIIEEHGGKISYQSEPNRGSVFTITLPQSPKKK